MENLLGNQQGDTLDLENTVEILEHMQDSLNFCAEHLARVIATEPEEVLECISCGNQGVMRFVARPSQPKKL
jgi:hypothetical protein